MKEEKKVYGFCIAGLDFMKYKDSITTAKGFIGVHVPEKRPQDALAIFATENDAKVCRNIMEYDGCRVGRDVVEVFVPKDEVRNAD